jgi:hypothetical protein
MNEEVIIDSNGDTFGHRQQEFVEIALDLLVSVPTLNLIHQFV